MNIDLLLSEQDETGLVSDKGFSQAVAGVMFDAQSGQLTLEFGDAEPFDLNIPVSGDTGRQLALTRLMHIGIIENGVIAGSQQVPLVLQNDPFGGGNYGTFAAAPRNSVLAFETFMKRAASGQPVHRDDLGDEAGAASILGGMSAATLQFAPHLSRQRAMEAAPRAAPAPSAPGLGPGGGRSAVPRLQQPRTPGPRDDGTQ